MTQPKLKWMRGPHLVDGELGPWHASTGPERAAMVLRVYEHTVDVRSHSVAEHWRRDQHGLLDDIDAMVFVVTYQVTQIFEISDDLIQAAMTPEGQERNDIQVSTQEQVAAYVGYHISKKQLTDIRKLDGFADRQPRELICLEEEWELYCTRENLLG